MATYNETKNELKDIAEILKLYPESLQGKVFGLLTSKYFNNDSDVKFETEQEVQVPHEVHDEVKDAKEVKREAQERIKPQRKAAYRKGTYQIIKELNLKGGDGKQSFLDFISSKQPTSDVEFNVLAIYYLERIINISPITVDHIYTCYKEAQRKVSENLSQRLTEASGSRYGYINIKNGAYTIPTRGENLVEHDLPKKHSGGK